jgi:RNA polymerase sigma-70 factor (ECF subfamily)
VDSQIEQAKRGDKTAMGRLLMFHDPRLRRRIARRIPSDLHGLMSVEDVLQETYVQAYRQIGCFEDRGADSFYRWLATIADHKLADATKAQRTAKRRPEGGRCYTVGDLSSSLVSLARLADGRSRTPSGIASTKEAEQAVRVALTSLPEACRRALWARYMEGQTVEAVAKALGRTPHAVHQLCHRGLILLREALGSQSR